MLNFFGLDNFGYMTIAYEQQYIPPPPGCGGGGGTTAVTQSPSLAPATQATGTTSAAAAAPNPCQGTWVTVRVDRRFYYLKDHLGTIKMTVDANGNVASYDDYYPYGMVMEGRSGNFGQGDTRYKFISKERDIETGYDWLDARGYDARIGRFLTIDPLADKGTLRSWSPYHYSFNNPMRFVDPTGLAGEDGLLDNLWNAAKMIFAERESKQPPPPEANSPLSSNDQVAASGLNKTIETAKENGHGALNAVANFSEDYASYTQLAGVGVGLVAVVAPPTAPVLGPIAGGLLTASSASDGVALLARGAEAAGFGGSTDAFIAQGIQVGADLVSQGLTESAVGLVIRETGVAPAFRLATSGRYVTNSFGYSMRAVADVTAVGTATIITRQLLNGNK